MVYGVNIMKLKNIFFSTILVSVLFGSVIAEQKEIDIHIGSGVKSLGFQLMGAYSGDGVSTNDVISQEMVTNADNFYENNYYQIVYNSDMVGGWYIAGLFQQMYSDDWVFDFKDMQWPDFLYFYLEGRLLINGAKEIDGVTGTTIAMGPGSSGDLWWFATASANDQELAESDPYRFSSDLYGDQWLPIYTDDGQKYCVHKFNANSNQYQIQRCGDAYDVHFHLGDGVSEVAFSPTTHVTVPDTSPDFTIPYYDQLVDNMMSDSSTLTLTLNASSYVDTALESKLYQATQGGSQLWLVNGESNINYDVSGVSLYIGGQLVINGSPVIDTVYLAQSIWNNGESTWWGLANVNANNMNDQLAVYTENGNEYCISGYQGKNNDFNVVKCSGSGGDSGTELKDNTVRIYPGSGVSSVSYQMEGFEVSDGQPYSSSLKEDEYTSDGYLNITFSAGRHKTDKVADDYRGAVGDHSSYGRNTSADYPGSLNFYIYGPLTINGSPVTEDVYLAQGSNDSGNNWWFGSKNAWQDSGNFMWVKTADGHQYCISNGDEDDYTFMVSNKCPSNDTTPHMAEIDIDLGDAIYSVEFKMDLGNTVVSSGQPHADLLSRYTLKDNGSDDNQLQMVFNAGHHESDSVADKFNSGDIAAINTFSDNNDYTKPGELYYYFYGDLVINGSPVVNKVMFAEESLSFHYDGNTAFGIESSSGSCKRDAWWVGSEGAENADGNDKLKLYTANHQCYVLEAYDLEDGACSDAEYHDHDHKFKLYGCYA